MDSTQPIGTRKNKIIAFGCDIEQYKWPYLGENWERGFVNCMRHGIRIIIPVEHQTRTL